MSTKHERHRIGVDIDEVLVDYLGALLKYFQERFGVELTRRDFSTYRLGDVFRNKNLDLQAVVQQLYTDPKHPLYNYYSQQDLQNESTWVKLLLWDFHESAHFQQLQPIEGAVEAITELAQHCDLVAITSRQIQIRAATQQFLAEFFPDLFHGLIMCNSMSIKGQSMEKKRYVEALGLVGLIEDSHRNLQEAAELDTFLAGVLVSQPWNEVFPAPDKVHRVQSLQEGVTWILSHFFRQAA